MLRKVDAPCAGLSQDLFGIGPPALALADKFIEE